MIGPCERGHWTKHDLQDAFQWLKRGHRYRVVEEFMDYDGEVHRNGETWTFLGASFLPHDDGQLLFVSMDDEREWQMRLQWRDGQQAHILDQFERYVEAAGFS